MSNSKIKGKVRLGGVVGIILVILGALCIASAMEYTRSVSDERPVERAPGLYSLSFHSVAKSNVVVSYNLSKGDMMVLVTDPQGYEEVLASGYPWEENVLLVLTETSNGSAVWTPSVEGTYYVIFMGFSEAAELDVTVSYTGGDPQLMELGIILLILGTSTALMGSLDQNMKSKKRNSEADHSERSDNPPR